MNPMFAKLMEQKKAEGQTFSGNAEKTANSNVIADLMHFLSGMEGDKLKGLKKVTVASNDPKGLEAGLSKAKDMVSGESDEMLPEDMSKETDEDPSDSEEGMEDETSEDEPASEGELADHAAHDEMSMEDLKKQVEMLKSMLASKGM